MKRLLLLLALMLVVSPVVATRLNFQNPTDATKVTAFGHGNTSINSLSWSETTNGGNNNVIIYYPTSGYGTGATFALKDPYATTYAAATYTDCWGTLYCNRNGVFLYDANKNIMWHSTDHWSPSQYDRFEVKVNSGYAYWFVNGVLNETSTYLGANPSFIAFGTQIPWEGGAYQRWDNYVYGDTEQKCIFGLPESDDDKFIILDDFVNDANDGLFNTTSNTQADATNMYSTFGCGNASIDPPLVLENQTVQLVNYDTGTVYWTGYTDGKYAGTLTVPIKTNRIDVAAPDGYYGLTIPGTLQYSNLILKRSQGATVAFDRDDYAVNDVAHVNWEVQTGDYWDTSHYTYRASLNDIYGVEKYGITLTERTGTFDYTFVSTDDPGVYHAQITATPNTGGNAFWLAVDYAELSSYVNFNGWVNNAQNQTVISGANVSMTQDGTTCNTLSAADGNYTCSGFSTGATWYVNATAMGFRQYTFNTTPLAAKGVALNISLVPDAPTITGLAIGGVDRDTTYGRPIAGATVTVRNTSAELYCYKTTSFTGWYLNDETDCAFQSKTPYDVWAYEIGYSNSTTEQAVTA